MTVAAVLGANVLYPIALADFLITTTGLGLYRAHWSPRILEEVRRNLIANRPDLTSDQITYRLGAMDRALPSASVDPPEQLIHQMTNHPKDRHVLAAAVLADAGFLVTFNVADFPAVACAPHDILVEAPDIFATRLVDDDPMLAATAIDEMASRRRQPPGTPDEIMSHLARSLPEAIRHLREAIGTRLRVRILSSAPGEPLPDKVFSPV